MNDRVRLWQEDAAKAFAWLDKTYLQAQALLDDAQALLEESDWEVRFGGGWGGAAYSASDLANWPFIYLKAFAARPREHGWDSGEMAALLGIFFYDDDRKLGPHCFGAVARWTDASVSCDHWMLYHAMGGSSGERKFSADEVGAIKAARPKPDAAKYKGLTELRWFEVPLAAINSPENLQNVVEATKALYTGHDEAVLSALRPLEG